MADLFEHRVTDAFTKGAIHPLEMDQIDEDEHFEAAKGVGVARTRLELPEKRDSGENAARWACPVSVFGRTTETRPTRDPHWKVLRR